MGRRVAAFLCLLSVIAAVGSAQAHPQRKADPNDSRDVIDIKSATMSHANGKIFLSMTSYNRWVPRDLKGGGITFKLDTKDGSSPDYFVDIYFKDGRLRAVVGTFDRKISAIPKERPSDWRVTTSFGQSLIDIENGWGGWGIETCCGDEDFAPNRSTRLYQHFWN